MKHLIIAAALLGYFGFVGALINLKLTGHTSGHDIFFWAFLLSVFAMVAMVAFYGIRELFRIIIK